MDNEKDTKLGWVIWVNSDLTEGRGAQLPVYICESETTAKRIGKGKDVQGTDATVTPVQLKLIDFQWWGPVRVIPATKQDIEQDAKLERKRKALEKAKSLGLTEDEIKDLYMGLTT